MRKPPTKDRPKILFESETKKKAVEKAQEDIKTTINRINNKNTGFSSEYTSEIHKDIGDKNPFGFPEWKENSPVVALLYIKDSENYITYTYCVQKTT